MAQFNTRDDLCIFDFDRCTGELSNLIPISFEDGEEDETSAGLAWSGADLKIYPNPTTGIIYFSDPAVTLVRVFDNIGRLQLQQEVTEDRLDLSHLQPSIYRLQVFRGSQTQEMRSVAISIR
jgi:hypothetical protein